MSGSNFSASTHLSNSYSKSCNFLCALGAEICSNLKLGHIQHSRILLYQLVKEICDMWSTNITWQQTTLDRKKQAERNIPPTTCCLNADNWIMGSNSKMKKLLYFLLGFGFALWSFYFFWKIMVFFGLEYWKRKLLGSWYDRRKEFCL